MNISLGEHPAAPGSMSDGFGFAPLGPQGEGGEGCTCKQPARRAEKHHARGRPSPWAGVALTLTVMVPITITTTHNFVLLKQFSFS